jgi:hypothetical protein
VATLKISTDISLVTKSLKASICKSVTDTLAILFSRCSISGVRAGSAIVDVTIAPDASQPSVAPTALAASIVAQAANPSSPLVASMQAAAPVVTSYVATVAVSTMYQCPDGSWQTFIVWYAAWSSS